MNIITSGRSKIKKALSIVGVDAKAKFSVEPPSSGVDDDVCYEQWVNAMKEATRLPNGHPTQFRRTLWLHLADHYIAQAGIDWPSTLQMAYCDKKTEDDDKLGTQIIKDVHRSGWSGRGGGAAEQNTLKRLLLAYARYNTVVGYCQGFNVIGSVVLHVVDYDEHEALKVMVYLLERVLPRGYFDEHLRALSVDMSVLAELMHRRLPTLANHLLKLQKASECEFEPALTNVFTMQWMLTLFATCLPRHLVMRLWDALMLYGSEILLRTALAIWAKISHRVCATKSADEFYEVMSVMCQRLQRMPNKDCEQLMTIIFGMSAFPYPGVMELRERYTWNIQPFNATIKSLSSTVANIWNEGSSSEGEEESKEKNTAKPANVSMLRKQYKALKQRQRQAAVILQNAYRDGQRPVPESDVGVNRTFNHLQCSTSDTSATVNLGTMSGGGMCVQTETIQPSGRKSTSTTTAPRPPSGTTTDSSNNTINNLPSIEDVRSGSNASLSLVSTLASRCTSNRSVGFTLRRSASWPDLPNRPSTRRRRHSVQNVGGTWTKGGRRSSMKPRRSPMPTHFATERRYSMQQPPSNQPFRPPTCDAQSMTSTELLARSKLILSSFEGYAHGVVPKPRAFFNPFPTMHRTSLIEGEKKFGLYK